MTTKLFKLALSCSRGHNCFFLGGGGFDWQAMIKGMCLQEMQSRKLSNADINIIFLGEHLYLFIYVLYSEQDS